MGREMGRERQLPDVRLRHTRVSTHESPEAIHPHDGAASRCDATALCAASTEVRRVRRQGTLAPVGAGLLRLTYTQITRCGVARSANRLRVFFAYHNTP